ncbi:helix-turn-helix transcriptional regulator [Mucilaginibacter sp. L3T2-6]|uniref:helix-turn-helix transcriptional regulator n=1 Tax=Mucilaginibacter sp. L3T2-6 TaxID=3062491 RepID=UPI002676B08E|nr:AraC family transcriptional regulator [Mucilaginibacter sp. L3T2-6]MDO3640703.1 AraC family transcriptional regulator [Mucilaginibacter sp. L3T2-6]MDV6212956.1 AraC family transcriptional regulator [Mucilaginibacter sp. L3T2-6]
MSGTQYPKIYLYRRIVYAKLFIDAHFAERIDLNNIADEAFFSKYHFIRLFHSVYNKTPHQYLSFVRIEQAKALLRTEISVANACYAVGFESVTSFTGLFKRLAGQTPAAYQLAQRQRQAEIAKAPLKFIPNCFAEKKGWLQLPV